MGDSNESQKVVQAVKMPLKGLIVSFGSPTRCKEVGSAAGPNVWGGAGESVGGVTFSHSLQQFYQPKPSHMCTHHYNKSLRNHDWYMIVIQISK